MKRLVAGSSGCLINILARLVHPRLTATLMLALCAIATPSLAMELRSPAFRANGPLPRLYACAAEGGKSIAPPLEWVGAPSATKSLAVTLQDLTSPHKVIHWIVYNIPSAASGIGGGVSQRLGEPGRNQLGNLGYDGPCPRHPGQANHYNFTLYALDEEIAVKNANFLQLQSAMKGHILARAELVGLLAPPAAPTAFAK